MFFCCCSVVVFLSWFELKAHAVQKSQLSFCDTVYCHLCTVKCRTQNNEHCGGWQVVKSGPRSATHSRHAFPLTEWCVCVGGKGGGVRACVRAHVCVCLSVSPLSLSVCPSLSVCLCLSLCVCFSLCVSLCLCLSVWLSVSLSLCLTSWNTYSRGGADESRLGPTLPKDVVYQCLEFDLALPSGPLCI